MNQELQSEIDAIRFDETLKREIEKKVKRYRTQTHKLAFREGAELVKRVYMELKKTN